MTASGQLAAVGSGLRTFAGDVAEGFFEITHNGLALLGVLTALTVVLLGTRADLRQQGEDWLADRLLARKVAAMGITPEPGAIERATAADPRELPREQAQEAGYGLAALIDGLWLRAALSGKPLDKTLAQSLTSHFISQHLPTE